MIVLFIILAILIILIAVILIRAALFKPSAVKEDAYSYEKIDEEKAVSNLQKLIQCKTVSYYDKSKEDPAEFEKLISLLPQLYPNVYKACSLKNFNNRGLLFHLKGRNHGKEGMESNVFMAHFDVVPVEEKNWDEDPFSGVIKDDVMWGRGTLDTKVTFNGILTAADELIGEGFVPEDDMYFAFGGTEETNGPAAIWIVDYFKENNIKLGMVLDEGGAVVGKVFPGVDSPVALVGIAEKGLLDLTYTTNMSSGHASAPAPHTSVGVLADAVCKIENHPFKMRLSEPVSKMLDTMGRESTFLYKIIFANLWCFKGILDRMTKKQGGELNALLRTTVAFTQMGGSEAPNVIPSDPYMRSNIRINPEETIDSVMAGLRERIGNDKVILEPFGVHSINPSPVSRTDCPQWDKLAASIRSTWGPVVVSPYLMVQSSDCRHYRDVSDKVYRFCAQYLTDDERKLIHGDNERITLEQIKKATVFFKILMKQF